jgi:hypothetical protein
MRTKRILRTLRKEKEKLDRESEMLGNVISVLEGRPGKKTVSTFKTIDRPHFEIDAAFMGAPVITPEIRPVPKTGPITGPKTTESSPEPPVNPEYYRLKSFKTA